MAALLGLMGGVSSLSADDTTRASASEATTNGASSTFVESHPELTQPAAPDLPNLTLQEKPAAEDESETATLPPVKTEASPEEDPAAHVEELAQHLLVVYNTNDPDSEDLAAYYAGARNIPAERILGITCPTKEEISRSDYEETVRQPIISYLCQKNLIERHSAQVRMGELTMNLLTTTRNEIWAIVLMRGIPLKIAPDPSETRSMESAPELQTNAAAVDSELALLPIFGLPKGGFVPNVFYDEKATGIKRVGPELAKSIILVTRLDAPTPLEVRRMIDDSLYAEKNRLAGLAVVDSRGMTDAKNGYTLGDVWLRSARDRLAMNGWIVEFDNHDEIIPATDPCNHVAFYLGWYAPNAAGPWVTPPDRFVRGAVAYHLHSFSAATLRSDASNWVGPLIAHGAAATMGTVYEPYLMMTPNIDIFTKRLLEGDYFAEAAYASERGLSWMTTVVGDPLYRPFHTPLQATPAEARLFPNEHDDWILLQQTLHDLAAGQMIAETNLLKEKLDGPGTGGVAAEGLGDLLEKQKESAAVEAAVDAYQKALRLDTEPVDRIRVGLKLTQHYFNHGQDAEAQEELELLRNLYPVDAKRFGIADQLVPTSIPPTKPAPEKPTANQPAVPVRPPSGNLTKPPGPPLPPMPTQEQNEQ